MKTAQPIRSRVDIEKIKAVLLRKEGDPHPELPLTFKPHRDYVLFITGIHICLRIGDLLSLKVSDVRDTEHIYIREEKTDKQQRFKISPKMQELFREYTRGMRPEQYLFWSQKGRKEPISRVQAFRILQKAAVDAGLNYVISCHSLRKTFGYWHYRMNRDVAMLQTIFGHTSQLVTLRYIGVTADEIDRSIESVDL